MEANGTLEDIINWEDCECLRMKTDPQGRAVSSDRCLFQGRPLHNHFRGFFFFLGGGATLLHAGFKQPLKAFADLHNTAVHH